MSESEVIAVITVTLKGDSVLSAQQYIEKIMRDSGCEVIQSVVSKYNNPFQVIQYCKMEEE